MFYSINGNLKSNKVIETLDILDLDSKILELENLNYTNSKIDSKLEKLMRTNECDISYIEKDTNIFLQFYLHEISTKE